MGIKIIAKNKRASFDYQLLEKVEAGLVLVGTEVKSIREGKVRIGETHISIDGKEEAWIHNMYVAPYDFGNRNNHEETRTRKLLLSKEGTHYCLEKVMLKNGRLSDCASFTQIGRIKPSIPQFLTHILAIISAMEDPMTKMRIGYIGLGTMGAPMAMNILKAGFPLTVYNRTPSKAADLIAAGAQWQRP